MTTVSYILIDYENVQPKDFNLVPETAWHVKIFLGPKQVAKHTSLNAAQRLGPNCDYINVLKPGPNALDFYIAYYLGILSRTKAEFYIISKDTGFDPLLEQLRNGNIAAHRFLTISLIPALAPKPKGASLRFEELVEKSVVHLGGITRNRPKTMDKLTAYLKTHLDTTPKIAASLAQNLRDLKIVHPTDKGEIIYQFENVISAAA